MFLYCMCSLYLCQQKVVLFKYIIHLKAPATFYKSCRTLVKTLVLYYPPTALWEKSTLLFSSLHLLTLVIMALVTE